MKSWNTEKSLQFTASGNELFGEYPQIIKEWLLQRYLLCDVPFHYIVPDEKQLPVDSVRFFYLDYNWLRAFADGATSIGRNTTNDVAIDAYANGIIHEQTFPELRAVRQKKMHKNHIRVMAGADLYGCSPDLDKLTPDSILTGFLLRSELVRFWKGIEVIGYYGTKRLEILRMEVLPGNILICLFDGEVDHVEMLEPAEALHFGTKANNRTIRIRTISGDNPGKPTGKTMSIPSETNGRVNVLKLVDDLALGLGVDKKVITSAEVALQMICVADMADFKLKGGVGNE